MDRQRWIALVIVAAVAGMLLGCCVGALASTSLASLWTITARSEGVATPPVEEPVPLPAPQGTLMPDR
jgi:hypothetical protein